MADWIESHRPGLLLGFDILHHLIRIGALLLYHRESTVAIGAEYQLLFHIVDGCIRFYTDRIWAICFPVSASVTIMTLLSHTENRRRPWVSIANPDGPLQGASDHSFCTFVPSGFRRTREFLFSMFTKTVPLPSVAANSGMPLRGTVATIFSVSPSMTLALWLWALNASTRFFVGSYNTASRSRNRCLGS